MQIPALLLDNFSLAQTALCLVNDKAEAIKQSAIKLKQKRIKATPRLLYNPSEGILPAGVTKSCQFAWNAERRSRNAAGNVSLKTTSPLGERP